MGRVVTVTTRGLQQGDAGHQGETGEEGRGELEAIVGVEVKLGQQVAQRDAEEGAGREGQRRGRPGARRDRQEAAGSRSRTGATPAGIISAKARLMR